jgi:hypothetical protein
MPSKGQIDAKIGSYHLSQKVIAQAAPNANIQMITNRIIKFGHRSGKLVKRTDSKTRKKSQSVEM